MKSQRIIWFPLQLDEFVPSLEESYLDGEYWMLVPGAAGGMKGTASLGEWNQGQKYWVKMETQIQMQSHRQKRAMETLKDRRPIL